MTRLFIRYERLSENRGWLRWCIFMAFTVLLLASANHVLFLLKIDNGVVKNDYWRFLPAVDQALNGEISLEEFVAPGNHRWKALFVPGIILFDAVFFDLRILTIHIGAILTISLVGSIFLIAMVRRSSTRWSTIFLGMVGALVLVSPMLTHLLIHGQASVSIYRVSIYIGAFLAMARVLEPERDLGWPTTLSVGAFLALTLITMGGGFHLAFVITLAVGFLIGTTSPHVGPDRLRKLLIVAGLALSGFLFYWSTMTIGGTIPRPIKDTGELLKDTPLLFVLFEVRLFTTSLLEMAAPQAPLHLQLVVGLGSILITVVLVVAAGRTFYRGENATPFLLSLYCLLVLTLITLGRASSGEGQAFARRYLADSILWQLALIWFLAVAATTTEPKKEKTGQILQYIAVGAAILVLSASHITSAIHQWKLAPFVARQAERQKALLLEINQVEDDTVLAKRLGLKPGHRLVPYAKEGAEILARNKWNVFRTGLPGSTSKQRAVPAGRPR